MHIKIYIIYSQIFYLMVDKEFLDKKFGLETTEGPEGLPRKRSNGMIAIKCSKHDDENASWECPICHEFYCSDCLKVINKKNEGQVKGICKYCFRRYVVKTTIFFGTIVFLFANFLRSIFL